MKKILSILLCGSLIFGFVGCGNDTEADADEVEVVDEVVEEIEEDAVEEDGSYSEFTWPTSGLIATMLPKPDVDVLYAYLELESDISVNITFYEISQSDFEAYIQKCQDVGYCHSVTIESDYFYGKTEKGSTICILYDETEYWMLIDLLSYVDDSINSSDSTSSSSSSSSSTASTESTDSSTSSTATTSDDGIRADFKEFMDSYEEFMDEYVAFMKKYQESTNAVSMLSEYSEYMTKYLDFAEKAAALEDDDLTTEELAYYLEVVNRVNQKLLELY